MQAGKGGWGPLLPCARAWCVKQPPQLSKPAWSPRRLLQGGPRCHFSPTYFANKLYKDAGYSFENVRWGPLAFAATASCAWCCVML